MNNDNILERIQQPHFLAKERVETELNQHVLQVIQTFIEFINFVEQPCWKCDIHMICLIIPPA